MLKGWREERLSACTCSAQRCTLIALPERRRRMACRRACRRPTACILRRACSRMEVRAPMPVLAKVEAACTLRLWCYVLVRIDCALDAKDLLILAAPPASLPRCSNPDSPRDQQWRTHPRVLRRRIPHPPVTLCSPVGAV